MEQTTKHRVDIRWMMRRDLPAVCEIEENCFEFPWGEADFRRENRKRNCITLLAEVDSTPVGYLVYQLWKGWIDIVNFAVDPSHHRHGIGTQLIDEMKGKLVGDRKRLKADVWEYNLEAQLFLKACGFRAIAVVEDYCEEAEADAYRFVYRVM